MSGGSGGLRAGPIGGGIGSFGTLSAGDLDATSNKSDLSGGSVPDFAGLDDDDEGEPTTSAPSKATSTATAAASKMAAALNDDESIVSSADSAADREHERMRQLAAKRALQKRGTVGGQKWTPEANWKAPKHEKSWEQHEHITSACAQSFLFSSLPPESLHTVVDAFEGPRTYAAGTYILTEGDDVTMEEPGLFIVDSGTLSVYKAKPGFAKPGIKVFAYSRMGDTFGELALLYNCPRQASVIASTECILWTLSPDVFNNCVKGAAAAMRQRFDKLIGSVDLLQGLRPDARNKIADVLHLRTHGKGERIITKGESGTEFFMLEEGRAYASIGGKRVKEYGPNDYFGELALTNNQPRAADVFADASPTILAVLDGESFKRLLGSLTEALAKRASTYSNAPQSALPSSQQRAAAAEDSEPESEGDEMDEAEFQKQAEAHKKRTESGKPREAVAAETWEAAEGWTPPVNSKTPAQYAQIEAACTKSWIFASLTAEHLKQVVDAFAGPTIVNTGQEVIREGAMVGTEEPGLFIFESGKMNVFKAAAGKPAPGNQVFTIDKPGHSFGEVALLYNCPRTATVVTAAPSTLWSIDRTTFNYCVKGAHKETLSRRVKFLESVEVLKGITGQEREKIAEVVKSVTFQKGDRIIKQGDPGAELFILEEGSAFASVNGQSVKTYGPGEYFGELALIRHQPRATDVFASSSPTKLVTLHIDSFTRLLGKLSDLMESRAHMYAPVEAATAELHKRHEEEDEEESELDEAEFLKQAAHHEKKATAGRAGGRGGITAESIDHEKGFTPPVFPKTPNQVKAIEAACKMSFVFSSLPAENFNQIVKAFKGPVKMKKGAEIIKEGDSVHDGTPALFVLEKGKLKVFKNKVDTKAPGEHVFTIEKAGASFGEVALLYHCPRTATVIAATDSVLWSIDRDTFNNCAIIAMRNRREEMCRFLENVDILRSLSAENRFKVAEVLQVRTFEAGDYIIKQGDVGTEFFMMEAGQAHASVDGVGRVKEYAPQDFFGELALMHRCQRAASVIADTSPVVCLVLDSGSFKRLLGNLTDMMEKHEKEYEKAKKPTEAHEVEEVDSDTEPTPQTLSRFAAEGEICRLKGRRRAVFAEGFDSPINWRPPVYIKTAIQIEEIKATIRSSFMFSALDQATFDTVVAAFKGPHTYDRGSEIIRQGEMVQSGEPALFILLSGKLDVFRHKPDQDPPGDFVTVLETAGRAFGEVSLVYNCPRTASVVARQDSQLWSIDRDTFNWCVKSSQVSRTARQEQFLSTVEILRHVSKEERHKLVEVMQMRSFKRGQVIIRKGDLSSEFYIMQEGTAFAILNGQRVKEYGASSYFGELALMYRQPRAADVVSGSEHTTLAVLDAGSFKRLLGNLQQLLIERAHNYLTKSTLGGPASWLVGQRESGNEVEWICYDKKCGFRNFGRWLQCFKCGTARTAAADPSKAIVPFQPQQILATQDTRKIPLLTAPLYVVSHGVELKGAMQDDVNVLYVAYPRRVVDVGIVQGTFPLVPGERFQVIIRNLGSFGEFSVGLAPSAEATPGAHNSRMAEGGADRQGQNKSASSSSAMARGSAMVGWNTRELGFTGDHGLWYFRGHLPGVEVSPPWEQGDVIECGMNDGGGVYMLRNGEMVTGQEGYWPAEDAHPTVTFHSGGGEVLLDLRNVAHKRPRKAMHESTPAKIATDMLSALKRTVLHHGAQSPSSFWCSCGSVSVARPEQNTPNSNRLSRS